MQHALRILRGAAMRVSSPLNMLLKLLKNALSRGAAAADAPAEATHAELRREHNRQAELELPGPDYRHALAAIHTRLKPRTYLEIGVSSGATLALANTATRALGVDPEPKLKKPPGPNARIYPLASDDFFAEIDVPRELDGLPVDLAFIDGMHLFEFALRDFVAIEPLCARASTILVHDTYPLNRVTAARARTTQFWSGDIWRLVLVLKKYRPDLAVHTIAAMPTGLTVIRNLDPGSRILKERLDAIIAEFLALDYATLDSGKPAALNLVTNDPPRIRALFE
jgi:predicted O-methyltransferase YrrM